MENDTPGNIHDPWPREHSQRLQDLKQAVEESRRIQAWLKAPGDASMRAYLEQQRVTAALRILVLLEDWTALGGRLDLVPGPVPGVSAPARALPPRPVEPRREVQVEHRTQDGRTEYRSVEVRPSEPRPLATPDSVDALRTHMASSGVVPISSEDWIPRLQKIIGDQPISSDDLIEMSRVKRTIDDSDNWIYFPTDVQRTLIGLCAARLRNLQDERRLIDARIDRGFSALTGYSKRERPGAVHGLARGHMPRRESWGDDAEAWWERLVAILPEPAAPAAAEGVLLGKIETLAGEVEKAPAAAADAVKSQLLRAIKDALQAGIPARHPKLINLATPYLTYLQPPEFRALRRAIVDHQADAEEEVNEETAQVPVDWKWWSRVRGRKALLVGGSPRETARLRLEQAFVFDSLEWEPTEFRRNSLQSVKARVLGGKIDLVIILGRFVGHDADDIILPAAREAGVDWVHVDHGYGVVRIRRAIERFLDPDDGSR